MGKHVFKEYKTPFHLTLYTEYATLALVKAA